MTSAARRDTRSHDPASRGLVVAILATGALFAMGMGGRPAGESWRVFYDVVLYHLPYLAAAGICWRAAGHVAVERTAWRALATGLGMSAVGDGLRVLLGDTGPAPLLALGIGLMFAGYTAFYVTLVALIRVRVPRFHPTTWLDGLLGALATTAVGAAFLMGPVLRGASGSAVDLAWPVADLVLLAMLVAVASILGIRLDRTVVLVTAAMACTLVGDAVLFALAARDAYTPGGPLELLWLASVLLAAVAGHRAGATRGPLDDDDREQRSRVGWRMLALPLVCNAASLLVLGIGWIDPLPGIAAWSAIGCVLAALARAAVSFAEMRSFSEVRQQALTDELTGLPNRRALLQAATRVVAAATARRPAALFLLDLDGFKEVNDGLGHQAGDELLRQISIRLRGGLREADLLSRLGGDEFAVLLPATAREEARAGAERLRAALLRPFTVEGVELHVGASIGVATTPRPAATVQELLRCADVAMYAAKRARTGVRVHVPDPDGGSGDRLRTMEQLRTALQAGELEVHLQPQVDLVDERVVGAEALVRWRHPRRGLLSPADLLPVAEQAGLLRPLADCVLDLALTAAARWWPVYGVPVSVNLSAADVTDLDLPWKVEAALASHGLPAGALTLELVEDTLMADPERGRLVLGELRRLGVRTSIDDYGTGYSSLAYLRNLPADELKLDRSLTGECDTDPRAAAIVRHTVALAHDLGLRLVAEGVEDLSTAAVLRDLGCDVAQGYAIARPMPVADFLHWLDRHPVPLAGTSVTG